MAQTGSKKDVSASMMVKPIFPTGLPEKSWMASLLIPTFSCRGSQAFKKRSLTMMLRANATGQAEKKQRNRKILTRRKCTGTKDWTSATIIAFQ